MGAIAGTNPERFVALKCEQAGLPHLKAMFIAFVRGALQTFQQFTSKFDDGGMIADLTEEEAELAFMPTTNDANEGMLGTWCIFI